MTFERADSVSKSHTGHALTYTFIHGRIAMTTKLSLWFDFTYLEKMFFLAVEDIK